MHRLNCWMCTLLAAFFCFAFLPRSAFAVEDKLAVIEAEIQAFEQKNAQQKAEVAKLNARIDALDSEIAKLVVQFAVAEEAYAREALSAFDYVEFDSSTLSEDEAMMLFSEELAKLQKAVEMYSILLHIDALDQEKKQLWADIAKTKAQVVADDTLGGPKKKDVLPAAQSDVVVVDSTTRSMPVPSSALPASPEKVAIQQGVVLTRNIMIDRHTPNLYRYWQRQDTLYKRNERTKWGDAYCRSVFVRGKSGYSCDAQIWRELPVGTFLDVPADIGQVGVLIPEWSKVGGNEVASETDASPAVLTVTNKSISWTDFTAALAIVFAFLAAVFYVMLKIARGDNRTLRAASDGMHLRLSEMDAIRGRSHEHGCCHAETQDASKATDASPKGGC